METSNSDAKHAVLHAQNDRLCLGPIEICYSGPKPSVCMQKPQVKAGTNIVFLFLC